ncbi:RNA polymerase factor sigma-54 [Sporosarcina sp. 179-K 3D1 HS]|uniref:RNA polymerase factor sigma-54 n=1 Tax=Sporosarcina sp. 179-K 3D1 HS TaxID=3232169 RepID=UPI0039A08FA0
MQMNVGLVQKQTTNLIMTTELRTAISLLQYSVLELSDFIQDKALSNPLIDMESTVTKESILESSFFRDRHLTSASQNGDFSPIDHLNFERKSLHDHLLYQMRLQTYPKALETYLVHIIFSLNENGYVMVPMEELCAEMNLSLEEGNQLLRMIQELEPAGIGARSLQECILLQLQKLSKQHHLAETIVSEYFVEYSERKWDGIAKKLKVTMQEIQQLHDVIQTLDPRPGAKFNSEITNFIVPEVYIMQDHDGLSVMLNDDCIPKVSLNRSYMDLLNDKSSEDYSYIKEKYDEAKQIQQSLTQRHSTLYKVAVAIVDHQKDFFYEGLKSLKPMTLKQIAEEIDVHESTISRVTTNKYMETPLGIFELKFFFTSGVGATNEQQEVSSSYLKELIQRLIDEEDKLKPLSDQDLVSLIEEQEKVSPSRRVIAKYRNELRIPSSSKRKRFSEVHC